MQIIDMLPPDSRAKVIQSSQSTLFEEKLMHKYNSKESRKSIRENTNQLNQNIMVQEQNIDREVQNSPEMDEKNEN